MIILAREIVNRMHGAQVLINKGFSGNLNVIFIPKFSSFPAIQKFLFKSLSLKIFAIYKERLTSYVPTAN